MKRLAFLGLGLFLASSAVGCSDDNDSQPIALDNVWQELAKVSCGKIFSCCNAEERKDLPYESEEACNTTAGAFAETWLKSLSESIDAGRQSYDGAAAGRCLDDMRALSCTEYQTSGSNPDCERVFRPLVAVGGDCRTDDDCVDGYCEGQDVSTEAALGVCAARRANGEECTQSGNCTSDYCDFSTGTCGPKQADGEPCSYEDDCLSDYCSDDGICGQPTSQCTL